MNDLEVIRDRPERLEKEVFTKKRPLTFTDIFLKDPCTVSHDWQPVGGRTCPRWEEAYVEGIRLYCSQTVYRCSRCGAYDHGEPGGPSFKECNDMCGPLERP
jgi:hypothetical protein